MQPEQLAQPAQPPAEQQEELCAARMAKWMQTPKTKRTIQSAKDMGKPAPFRQAFEERNKRKTVRVRETHVPFAGEGGRYMKRRGLLSEPQQASALIDKKVDQPGDSRLLCHQ